MINPTFSRILRTLTSYGLPFVLVLVILNVPTACEERVEGVDFSPDTTAQNTPTSNPNPNNDTSAVDNSLAIDTTSMDRVLVDTVFVADEALTSAPVRRLLLEDFTGVRCTNCPRAQQTAKQLAQMHPGRISLVALHGTGNFNRPYRENQYDFRLEAAQTLLENLGGRGSLPIGTVNRASLEGEILYLDNQWPKMVSDQINTSAALTLRLWTSYDPSSREAILTVRGHWAQTLDENLNLTVYVVENGLVDYQKDGVDKVPDYKHEHVLRTIVTPSSGQALAQGGFEAQQVFVRELRLDMNAGWVAENCRVVAFVHRSRTDQEVLQVVEVPLTD